MDEPALVDAGPDVLGGAPLQPVDPAYRTVLRISALIPSAILLAAAVVAEAVVPGRHGLFLGPVLAIAVLLVAVLPPRRYRAWGFALDDAMLRIVRGRLFRSDTVVPLGRVQHVDVDQGPIARRFDLATLTVHTAGTAAASVSLHGLRRDVALAMRDAIAARIKRGSA